MRKININAVNVPAIADTISHYRDVLKLIDDDIELYHIKSKICTRDNCHLCKMIIDKLGDLDCKKCVHYHLPFSKMTTSMYCVYQDTYRAIESAKFAGNRIELYDAIKTRIKYLEKIKIKYDNSNLKFNL